MSEKKYVSLNRLTNYDALIKAEIAEGDYNSISSANSYAKSYTDSEVKKLTDGTTTVAKATSSTSATSATKAIQDASGNVITSHYETKSDATTKLNEAKNYTDTKVSGLASTTVVDNKISTHNTSTSAHNDIRNLISGLTTRLNTLADSDDTTLDQMSEVVEYIKSNKTLIDSVTTSKVNVSDIVNNLTTNVTNKPLSAAQGVVIKELIDTLQSVVDGKANATHSHAISDVSGLQSALDGKANTSHGNHVPATQTASNKVFLRNDNTWATVTPANIGAAASSHTHKVANISDLTATVTELNYMDGVTSSVQTQLNDKVPKSRTVNGKALSANITLSASDVDAYTKAEIDAMSFITVDDIDKICT